MAEQTYEQIKKFKKYLDNPKINELLVIGGVNIKEQINALQNQGVNIVVGTPGRLEDLIQGGKNRIIFYFSVIGFNLKNLIFQDICF